MQRITISSKLWSFLLATFALLFLDACFEPEKKPVPPLDLSKAVVDKDKNMKTQPKVKIGKISKISVGDLYQLSLRNAALIFDVRPILFHKMGKIPGSISWPISAFDREFKKQEPRVKEAKRQNMPIVLYCTDLACPDAQNVAIKLSTLGYDVSVLEGGYAAWRMLTQ